MRLTDIVAPGHGQAMQTGGTGEPATRRDRGFLIYVAAMLLVLAPGLLARADLGLPETSLIGGWIAEVDRALKDIAFGHGLRFWLGVAGASAMGFLLLYPLRKLLGLGRIVTVGGWFNLHIVLGLLGPVLILYHCNFGPGSTPANVALVSMLVVTASGFIGHFLYTRLSAGFYDRRGNATGLLADAIGELQELDANPTKTKLIDDLSAFESQITAKSRGLLAGLVVGVRLRPVARDVLHRAAWLIDTHGRQQGWSAARCADCKSRFAWRMDQYFAAVRRSARWAAYERAGANWRLLHLPLFAITIVAATIHVVKVWGMDDGAGRDEGAMSGAGTQTTAAISPPASSPAAPDPEPQPRRKAAATAAAMPIRTIKTVAIAADGAAASEAAGNDRPPVLVIGPKLAHRPKTAAAPNAAMASAGMAPAMASTDVTRAPERSPGPSIDDILQRDVSPPVATETARPEPPTKHTTTVRPHTAPAAERPQPIAPAPTTSPPAAARDTITAEAAVAELARRNAVDNRGRFDAQTLARRIKELKAESFDHGKTQFPLTGKHAKASCESCHKSTLKDTPRDCITCHKKDDVHRGRKPACADCHVTTDWGTIKRRK